MQPCKKSFLVLLALCLQIIVYAEDGYKLWLRYIPITDTRLKKDYISSFQEIIVQGKSSHIDAIKKELDEAFHGMLGIHPRYTLSVKKNGTLIIGTPGTAPMLKNYFPGDKLQKLGKDGFIIQNANINNKKCHIIAANTDLGILYGTFHFLRLLQCHHAVQHLTVTCIPKISYRLLDHWDNLDRTVERGYAGCSIWDWRKLPDYRSPQYTDYARANASIGINGAVLNNVNANSLSLTAEYLRKAAAIADVFRSYGIKVYLTAKFSAPSDIGGLANADPLNPEVINWWQQKIDEIYRYIPDFGGFLVKANSEGQPGPQKYGRTHADGANMLAAALAPHGGVVMWRAFVYDNNVPDDRAKQAFNEFKPLDGKFRDNIFVQVKNGAIDFQPREPFHPLFGAMPQTPLMLEVQITQEYLGQGTHLVYLAPLFKECLHSDTYSKGIGSYVSKIIDGTREDHRISGIAGVANIGNDRNWCGHIFGQANWYAFGRLAWDHTLPSGDIAREWIIQTFSDDEKVVNAIEQIMMASREILVNYMTPLGLHHIMGWDHHYGPAPWINQGRPDWTSVYYHRADSVGLGFDRSSHGSNAVSQYFTPVKNIFDDIKTCPENLLLWFHHVKWDYTLKSGHTLWEELCYKYSSGVDSVGWMQQKWAELKGCIDEERFLQVQTFLSIQKREAEWWRDACLLYFQTFSKQAFPKEIKTPLHTLEYYKNLKLL